MPGEVKAVTKFYDVVKWLMPQISKFPRSYKFTLGDRITNLCLDILMLLVEANYAHDKINLLQQSNWRLEQLRYLLRLSKDFQLFSLERYAYIAGQINEVGNQIGGWLKQQRNR